MSKYVPAIVVGFVVALGLSWLLTSLTGPGLTSIFPGVLFGAIAAYAMANLAGNRKVTNADAAQKSQALKLEPPEGKALLVVWREGFWGMAAGLNISVDGRDVAQLKSPRFTQVALTPGSHMVTAAFGGLAGPQNRADSEQVQAEAGKVIAYKVGLKVGAIANSVAFTPQPDLAAVKAKLAGITMVLANPAEV